MENTNFLDTLIVPTQSNGKISFVDKINNLRKSRTQSYKYGLRYMAQVEPESLSVKHTFLLPKRYMETNNVNSFWTIAKNSSTNEVYLIQSLDGLHKTYVKLWQGVTTNRSRISEALFKLLESVGMLNTNDEIVDFELVQKEIPGISDQLRVYSVVTKLYDEDKSEETEVVESQVEEETV